jgi:hypothetical protein
MKQPPQKLLRQAVAAFIRYIQSDRLSADRQTTLRQKAEHLADETAKAMGAKDENERLVVWEELNRLAHRQIENERLKALGVEGF